MKNENKIKVNYIKWERSDAIGKVTSIYLNHLKDKVDLNVITLKTKSKNKFLRVFQILGNLVKVFKLLFQNSIIHFEEPKNFESIVNFFFKYKKSILTVNHLEEKKHNRNISFLKWKWKHNSFSKLIAISEKTKTDLIKEYGINPNKIETVYLGVDKNIFRQTNKKVKGFENKKYILYLGSELPRKNIPNLLKSFKNISLKYPELILLKAGYSSGDQYRVKTKKLIKQYGLTNKVIFINKHISEKELPIYYSNAELFVYPTLQEGFGMPLVEAMACGCPVVTSNISPMKEIAKGQVLVNPYDFESITKGIDEILSNKKYREILKKNAIDRANDFDWEKSAKKILEIYKELQNQKLEKKP